MSDDLKAVRAWAANRLQQLHRHPPGKSDYERGRWAGGIHHLGDLLREFPAPCPITGEASHDQ